MNDFVSVIMPTRNRAESTLECLLSIYRSSHKNLEVIVVDNASTDNTGDLIRKKYPSVKLVVSEYNRMAVGGRNLGIEYAKGEFLLFIDSDNEIDPNMISALVSVAKSDHSIGLLGPKIYCYDDRERLWCAGADISLVTGKTTHLGAKQIDVGQFDVMREVGHMPNVFMVSRKALIKAGGKLRDVYRMTYGESDFAMNIKKAGFKVVVVPAARTYHKTRVLYFDTPDRIYYLVRNRVLFMKEHAPFANFMLYMLCLYPMYVVYYAAKVLRHKPGILSGLIVGVFHGYLCAFNLNVDYFL